MAEQVQVWSLSSAFEAARIRITDTRREPLARRHPDDAQFPYPGEPFGIAYPLSVPDFGRVYLWADGKGYTDRMNCCWSASWQPAATSAAWSLSSSISARGFRSPNCRHASTLRNRPLSLRANCC